MPQTYYTENGQYIRKPTSYASTSAPMYKTKKGATSNINQPTYIYKMSCENNKTYIGKTTNLDRRMNQHFSGNGSKVTQKFAPLKGKVIDKCPGFFVDNVEQLHTEAYISKKGYNNVRGGTYTNSKTLKATNSSHKQITCFKCGKQGHYANSCYS